MKENKASKALIVINAILAALLIAFWSFFFVLNAQNTPKSGSLPALTLPFTISPTTASTAVDSPSASVPDSEDYYYQDDNTGAYFATAVPPGPYIPVDESNLGQLYSYWYYSYELATTGILDKAYDLYFNTSIRSVRIRQVFWVREVITEYHGTFTLQSPGIMVATLEETPALDNNSNSLSTVEITMKLEYVQSNPDVLVATITNVSSSSPRFEDQFSGVIGVDCPYYRYTYTE